MRMPDQNFLYIEKGASVYHVSYGWGEVTAGDSGTSFQVKFPHRNEIYSFHKDGSELFGGQQVVFNNEVTIFENPKTDKELNSFATFVSEDRDVALRFNGVNNAEILTAMTKMFGVVCSSELSKGNTKKILSDLVNQLKDEMLSELDNADREKRSAIKTMQ